MSKVDSNENVDLTVLAIEASNFPRRLAIRGAFFQIGALVARNFTLTDAELGFELAVFPIELQHHERATFDLTLAVKLVDFFAMKQKFANAFRGRNFVARFFVRLNIGVVEKRFTVLDPSERIVDVGFAGADRFYFAAFQLDTRFVTIENVKIAECLTIEDRLGGHVRALNAPRI